MQFNSTFPLIMKMEHTCPIDLHLCCIKRSAISQKTQINCAEMFPAELEA